MLRSSRKPTCSALSVRNLAGGAAAFAGRADPRVDSHASFLSWKSGAAALCSRVRISALFDVLFLA